MRIFKFFLGQCILSVYFIPKCTFILASALFVTGWVLMADIQILFGTVYTVCILYSQMCSIPTQWHHLFISASIDL